MKKFTHNLAIAIGINQYQNGIAKLNTAKPDAQTLADILRDNYQYQVELITDDTEPKPTLKELENLLTKWLPEQLQPPAENNRLLFYFAGHGMPLESDDGPRGFLLPQDANPNPKPGESHNFLSMQVLHDALVALPCHHLIVILDCCFAGTFRWASTRKLIPIPETIHREHYDRFIRYPAWQVITSAAHNQEALDFLSDKRGISEKSQGKQHSPFAEALFEALQDGEPDEKGRRYKKADLTKDGVITAPELYLYLRDNVETRSGDRQTPGLYPLKKHDRGEYIFHAPNFDRESLSEADPIDETNNPYRGLKPFEEEHARFFFGRQELIENLYTRIAAPDHSLTVVLGVSGSGKSSLVKAGLIPYLRELSKPNNNLHQWHILNPIRPGESPFAALARTIWAIADLPSTVQLESLGFLSERLNQEIKQLQPKIAEASRKHGETSRTTQRLKLEAEKFTKITTTWNQDSHTAKQLLIVEHFETLYALCSTKTEPESQQQWQLKQVFLTCLNPLTMRLQSAANSLVEIVKAWSQKHPNIKLFLLIDQFEELITLGRKVQPNQPSDALEEWQEFLQLLETTLAANLPQLRIIITLRSDFEPRFLNSEALKSYWTKARFPVRAMRSDELRQAIAAPASEMALYFEPANLVDRLIDEVGQMPGALPLLSFTLSEFYIKLANKWKDGESSDRALTIDADFDKEGGVAGSLTRKANEEYNKIGDELGAAAQITMRRVMLRMLTLEGGETARRRVPESELEYPTPEESDRVKQVVERLVEARLLVKGQLETGEPYVEPAHDFLVRGWGTLQNWIDEEKAKETLELQQRLTAQANDWARNQGPLLPDGDRLNQLEKLLKQNDTWLNQRESQFVETSLNFRDAQKRRARELLVRAELQQKAARVLSQISINPLEAITTAIQATGQNLEELPNEILAPVQRSLHTAMNKARIPKRSFVGQHTSRINSIAFHPNSQYIVSGSDDKTIRLWNWEQGLVTPPFLGHEGEIKSVVFGHNGQYIISASTDGTIRVWNFQLQLLGEPFVGHQGGVNSVAISPDGQYIISGGTDGTIRFWNSKGEQLRKPLTRHQGGVNSVAISPDGQYIISGGVDNTVCLWNSRGQPIGTPFVGHQEPSASSIRKGEGVYCAVFSPDSQSIASSGVDSTIRLWNLEGGLIIPPLNALSLSVDFHPSKRRLVGLDGRIQLWTTDGRPIEEFFSGGNGYSFNSVAFSPNGKYIAAGGNGGHLQIWDLEGDEIGKPFQAHNTEITDVVFSPDGQKIASSSFDKTIRLWNLEGKQIEKTFAGHEETVYSIAFSPQGKLIASGSYDRSIRLWNLKGEQISSFGDEDVRSVAFNPNAPILASTGMEATVRLWDFKGNAIGYLPYGNDEKPAGFNKIAFSQNGEKIACLGPKFAIRLWDWKNNLIQDSADEASNVIQSIGFSPDGRMIVTSDVGGSVCLWDLDNNFARQELRLPSSVHAACFSPVAQTLVSGTADRKVFLSDIYGNIISTFEGQYEGISALAFSPDGRIVASGGWNGTINLWRGSWKAWLEVCCDRVRHHPVFKDPEVDSAKAVCEICQKYVWSREDTSV
ncbi:MAG: caspase family protein [Nostoc sp. DedQUE11]|nr:caspase family protein [Nostoc sp. DedQUE11]